MIVPATLAACGPDWDILDPSLGPAEEPTAASSSGAGGAGAGAGGAGSSASSVSSTAATSSGSSSSAQGSSSSGGPTTSTIDYDASVAECVDPTDPDPSAIGVGAVIWAGVQLLLALFVGGMVATRVGAIIDRTTGLFEGVLV